MDSDSATSAILMETTDGITTVTLNRPEKLNALDTPARQELLAALRAVDDEDSRVVILTGTGRAFCAGGDVKAMEHEHSGDEHTSRPVHSIGRHLVHALQTIEKPIIAKVNGAAIGLGATLALFCDVVLIASDARIGDSHARVGLTAGDGGAVIWPLLVGPLRAKELLMTGRPITGEEAAKIGLVNAAYPAEELGAAVEDLAKTLRDRPAYAVRTTKAAVNRMVSLMTLVGLDTSLAWEHLSMSDAEHHQAIQEFSSSRRSAG